MLTLAILAFLAGTALTILIALANGFTTDQTQLSSFNWAVYVYLFSAVCALCWWFGIHLP